MSTPTDDAMPERYRAPQATEHTVGSDTRGTHVTPTLNIPPVALHKWIDCEGGDRLGVAPKSPTAVTVGADVQPDVATLHTTGDKRYTTRQLSAHLPLDALRYLNAAPGDTVRVRNVDGPRIVVEVVR